MKAVVRSNSEVRLKEIPFPACIQPDDVIVRVKIAGLCRTDVYVGLGYIPAKEDIVLGHEFSGEIVECGAHVSHLSAGERVSIMPIFNRKELSWPIQVHKDIFTSQAMLGIHFDGCFSEYVRVPVSAIVPLPADMPFKTGAYLEPVAASLSILQANINRNERGLIWGNNRIAELLTRVMHAHEFTHIETLSSLSKDIPDSSYDYLVESTASKDNFEEMLRLVKPGGKIIIKSRQFEPVGIRFFSLIQKEITLQAVNYAPIRNAMQLLSSPAFKVEDLFGKEYSLEEMSRFLPHALEDEHAKPFISFE